LPFREEGMGWGVELDWIDLRPEGCRLGIVDATPIDHLGAVGAGYDAQAELDRLLADLEARGHPHWRGLRRTLATWWLWQSAPTVAGSCESARNSSSRWPARAKAR